MTDKKTNINWSWIALLIACVMIGAAVGVLLESACGAA